MKGLSLCIPLSWICLSLHILCGESLIPRGLDPQLISLYNPDGDFQCIYDHSSKIIPFSYVNDDYCDCEDGSDEPGTSACSNGSFYCANAGYRPRRIFSSRVNDGICDCCDGSDEWDPLSLISCPDTCLAIGEASRIEAQRRTIMIQEALKIKISLIEAGSQTKKEKEALLHQKEELKMNADKVREELLEKKIDAEAKETAVLDVYRKAEEEKRLQEEEAAKVAEEEEMLTVFYHLDTNSDGRIVSEEIQIDIRFDQNGDGIVSAEEASYFLSEQESYLLNEFREKGWLLMKSYIKGEKAPSTASDVDTMEEDESIEPSSDDGREEFEDGQEEEFEDETVNLAEDTLTEEPKTISTTYDPETQELVDIANNARSAYKEAEDLVKGFDREIDALKKELSIFYGPHGEYGSLYKNCFEISDAEYTYKLCLFDYCSQKSLKGGPETRLGNWNHWKSNDMFYDKGQQCWNGPARSTIVKVACGLENKLVSTSEPNKCEYEFHFETPAACTTEQLDESKSIHDEL